MVARTTRPTARTRTVTFLKSPGRARAARWVERARELYTGAVFSLLRSERTRERAIPENGSGEGYVHTRNGGIVGETGAPGRDRMCNLTEGERGRTYARTRERAALCSRGTTTSTSREYENEIVALLLVTATVSFFLPTSLVACSSLSSSFPSSYSCGRIVRANNRITDVRSGTNCCARLTTTQQLRLGYARQRDWDARGSLRMSVLTDFHRRCRCRRPLHRLPRRADDFSHLCVSVPSRLVPSQPSRPGAPIHRPQHTKHTK